ncbi:MAG: hypothetical protein H0X24_02790 [Ktedonobacterales bacterium]|nr:hypothetical protein [Ktedonobacterales bacterium]
MVQQPPAPRPRRGIFSFVRGWWQRKPNTLPASDIALSEPHEPSNAASFAPPTSDRRTARKEDLQQISYFAAQVYLVPEFATQEKVKPNLAQAELAAYAAYLVALGDDPEPRNGHTDILAFLATHPELDDKPAGDWVAFRPNKEVITPQQLDPETLQRIKFTRFLRERGTYNEGFEEGEEPPQYHRTLDDFSRDDLRSDK